MSPGALSRQADSGRARAELECRLHLRTTHARRGLGVFREAAGAVATVHRSRRLVRTRRARLLSRAVSARVSMATIEYEPCPRQPSDIVCRGAVAWLHRAGHQTQVTRRLAGGRPVGRLLPADRGSRHAPRARRRHPSWARDPLIVRPATVPYGRPQPVPQLSGGEVPAAEPAAPPVDAFGPTARATAARPQRRPANATTSWRPGARLPSVELGPPADPALLADPVSRMPTVHRVGLLQLSV
jgi:hypothetical protein